MKLPKQEKALSMYRSMQMIRKYEERIYYLFLEGAMPGSIHQSHGQEACAVGVLHDLKKGDYMASTHRPAGHDLAMGVSLKSMFSEMFGKKNGCSSGKGGAMHTGDIEVGAVPANAIVGGNIPIAVGIAMSCKMRKTDNVVVSFFGDGATNEGSFHEGLNGAAIWDLPVIFVCENNLYGASTSIKASARIEKLSDRAAAYGMPGITVDGNDVLAVQKAAETAIKRAREGKGPTFLELRTYRIAGHSRSDACAYRDDDEEKEWFSRDPINRFRTVLIESGINEEELDAIDVQVDEEIEEAVEFARNSPDPLPEDALTDVYWKGAR
jgi:pyruvate dehydrogenase E1 component alpha subunit